MKPSVPETLPGAKRITGGIVGVLRLLGYVMLVAGIVGMATSRSRLRAARERTELPVKLQAGQEFRAPIQTSAKGELIIELRLNRHERVSDALLDEILFRETNALHIDWAITQEGVTNSTGTSTNAREVFTSGAASKTKAIGHFKPPRAGAYEFTARVRSDLPELESARPYIVIRPTSAFLMSASLGASVGLFGGGILGLVGLILILLAKRERESVSVNG